MLESPAYRVLSLSAHRVLARLEIEIGHHGGHDNGKLQVTYESFVQYGTAFIAKPLTQPCVTLQRWASSRSSSEAEPVMQTFGCQANIGSPTFLSEEPSLRMSGEESKPSNRPTKSSAPCGQTRTAADTSSRSRYRVRHPVTQRRTSRSRATSNTFWRGVRPPTPRRHCQPSHRVGNERQRP